MSKTYISKFLLISILLLSLNGCGGGGSSSTTKMIESNTASISNQESTPLTVHAGSNRKAQINEEITIYGYITGNSEITSYEWTKENQVLATTLKFKYIPTKVGIDILQLTIVGSDGNSFKDTIEIEVLQEYQENLLPF